MSLPDDINALPRTSRGWIILAVIGVLLVVAFSLVTVFYNAEGGIRTDGGVGNDSADGILVVMSPDSIQAVQQQASIHLAFRSNGATYVDNDGHVTQDLRISVETGSGTTEVRYPAGVALGQTEIVMALDGEAAAYPFDHYAGTLSIAADNYKRNSDGTIDSTGTVPIALEAEGGVNGWDTNVSMTAGVQDFGMAEFNMSRAFSTQVFAILIVVLAAVLALFVLLVGVLVFNARRPAEVALLGWTAAVIFALPLLRNYMPNAPPFGAAIDVYAYLWLIVLAIAGAVLTILAWLAQRKPPAQAKAQPPTPGGSNAA